MVQGDRGKSFTESLKPPNPGPGFDILGFGQVVAPRAVANTAKNGGFGDSLGYPVSWIQQPESGSGCFSFCVREA